jgi:MFS family permease
LNRFRGVWDAPHARSLLVSSFLARFPYGMIAFGIVLFVHDLTGSFARAGAVSAASAIAAGIGLPVLGRLVDRLGQTRVLLVAGVLNGVFLAALIALGLGGAGTGVLVAVAFAAGLFVPPVSPCIRGVWPDVLSGEEKLRSAFALDAILLEMAFIGGPTLTAGLVAVASPAAALAVAIGFTTVGTLWFAATPPSRAWRGTDRPAGWLGPLRSPGLRTLMVSSALLGFPIGALDVALPAFGVAEGSRSLGGVFIAAMAAGSLAGGVWYGARGGGRGVLRAYLVLSLLFPVGFALVALPSSVLAMLIVAPIAGAVWAPLTTAENELTGAIAPAGTVTEAYAWIITAVVTGVSAGTLMAGVVVDASGWRDAVLVGVAVAAASAVWALARRHTLETPRRPPSLAADATGNL